MYIYIFIILERPTSPSIKKEETEKPAVVPTPQGML